VDTLLLAKRHFTHPQTAYEALHHMTSFNFNPTIVWKELSKRPEQIHAFAVPPWAHTALRPFLQPLGSTDTLPSKYVLLHRHPEYYGLIRLSMNSFPFRFLMAKVFLLWLIISCAYREGLERPVLSSPSHVAASTTETQHTTSPCQMYSNLACLVR